MDRALPVKELPQVDADRAQAKTTTRIGVEQNGPIVKLLPENHIRIAYGLIAFFQSSILPSVVFAMSVPEKHYFV